MKTIPLSMGKTAFVSDEDYDWLNQWKWSAAKRQEKNSVRWYAVRRERISPDTCRLVMMHRLILGIIDPKIQVDHENSDGLDNQRINLRQATPTQNQANRRKPVPLSSKYKGVCWDRSRNKWLSSIRVHNLQINLGRFRSESDAAATYNSAAQKHFGEFALLNQI